jgi:hypothetical protein
MTLKMAQLVDTPISSRSGAFASLSENQHNSVSNVTFAIEPEDEVHIVTIEIRDCARLLLGLSILERIWTTLSVWIVHRHG